MSGYLGASAQNQQKRFINGSENNNHTNNNAKHYLNQNYPKTQSQTDHSGGSYSKLNMSFTPKRDIQSEKSRIAESSSVNYGLVNQRAGNGGYSLHESSSHGSKDNPKVSPSHSPLNNNPGKEFFTSKPSQKLSQPSRQEGTGGQTSSHRAISGYESQLPYSATTNAVGTQIRNSSNVTPKKHNGFDKIQADKSMESSLERFRGVQRQTDITSRRISGNNDNINALNQEILSKMKQLSNSPISRSFHNSNTPAKTFNSQLKQGIDSRADNDRYAQLSQGVANCSSKTPKSAKNITEHSVNSKTIKQDQQGQFLKGYETERMKRSITPTDIIANGNTKAISNSKLQEMLNRVQQLTSNLKTSSQTHNVQHQQPQISPLSESGYNLERRLTPMHQAASDGFTPRSDTSHNHKSNQASPGGQSSQQYLPFQQQIMMTMNSSKVQINNKVNQDYQRYLEQQQCQQNLVQSERNGELQNSKCQTRDTSQKQNKQQNNNLINQKVSHNQNINNTHKISNPNKDTDNRFAQNNINPMQKQEQQQQQQEQLSQLKTLNIDLPPSKSFQKQIHTSERPSQRQQATPTFAQVSQQKQHSQNQNQLYNFSGKSNQNNTEEANTTSGSGNTYGNNSQSVSRNSPSHNDLSQESSIKKSSTGQDAALLRLLQEKLGDQYSYLLAGRQIELETPRKAVVIGNNSINMKASEVQREQQSARSTTPRSQHSGLIKQLSTPTIFSQSPQVSPISNKLDNSSIFKQQQGQFQHDGAQQIAWLRQQQQQQQQQHIQQEVRNPYSTGGGVVPSPSVNMYYPQFSEYQDSTQSQDNQQNQISNQLLNTPSYDFSGNLTNSQYFNPSISLNNHNLCSSPDLNQSNSQYLISSRDLNNNNSTQNALFNPYMMINNFQQQPKTDSPQLPLDSLKINPAHLLYLQQLQQQQQQLQFLQAPQSFPNRSEFIPNSVLGGQMNVNQQILQQHLANSQFLQNQNNKNMPFQQQQSQVLPLTQSSFAPQQQQAPKTDDLSLLQSQRIIKEDSTQLKHNNQHEECPSSSTSSTNTPVTIQINTQISNNEQQLSEQSHPPPAADSATLQKIIKSCARAEECIYELLQSREFEHQAHFLVKYHLLLPDLPLLQKLPISSPADMKEIQRSINMQILLVQVIVYEHIVVIKQLRESVRGAVSMNENLQNILNSFQYVHSSLILTLIIFEQAIENLKDQGDISASSVDISALSATIRERTKRRKMGFLLKNSDKLAMLKKFNDILQPLLQILVEGQIEMKEDETLNEKNSIITSALKDSSFYEKLLEIQDKIPSMPIASTIELAEQLSKENIQLVQDEADKLALMHERKAFTMIKEQSHGQNQDSDNEESKSSHQKSSDSPQRSLKKQPTCKAQTQSLISSQQESSSEGKSDNSAKQVETDKADELVVQQETKEITSQELSLCGPVNAPYLKDVSLKKYTLVLDLDETLVHYQELDDGGQFLVRPYAETFLEEMSEYYEIIIFTAGLQDYADFILDIIDVKKSISHRFYRQHTTFEDNFYVKVRVFELNDAYRVLFNYWLVFAQDLSRIGRNLDKTLIIDNLPENFKFQPENGIQIQSWYGEPEDRALYDLTPLLKQIVKKRFKKVQTAFTQFREKTIQNISKGIQDPHLNLSLDPLPEDLDD